MAYRFEVSVEHGCVFFEATGTFTTDEMFRCIADVAAHEGYEPSFNHIVDLTGLDQFEPDRAAVRKRAQADAEAKVFAPGVRIALVVAESSRRGARAYLSAVMGAPICARMFSNVVHARSWLGLDSGPFDATPVVMVVDDHDAARSGIAALMVAEGFEVIGASDGATAMATHLARPCDLVLVDHRLPDMEGVDLLSALNGHPRPPKFVLVSGTVTVTPDGISGEFQALWERYKQAGAAAHAAKPVDFDALLATVGEVLNR